MKYVFTFLKSKKFQIMKLMQLEEFQIKDYEFDEVFFHNVIVPAFAFVEMQLISILIILSGVSLLIVITWL